MISSAAAVPQQHITSPGECLSSIAEQRHFFDWRTTYGDRDNAPLRALRADPNVLAPRDVVVIPDKGGRIEEAATGATHVFEVTALRATLRLVLEIDAAHYRLTVDGRIAGEGQPPSSGLIEHRIARDAARAELLLWFSDNHADAEAVGWDLRLGHLDPAEGPGDAGVVDRLRNLGFLAADETGPDDMRRAVVSFQRSVGLPPTGEADPTTRDRLRQAHDVL